jgi:hypothetical protein
MGFERECPVDIPRPEARDERSGLLWPAHVALGGQGESRLAGRHGYACANTTADTRPAPAAFNA